MSNCYAIIFSSLLQQVAAAATDHETKVVAMAELGNSYESETGKASSRALPPPPHYHLETTTSR